jgi:hypothetical protein
LINGIKTKLVRSEGYWQLVIADKKIAMQLASQVPGNISHLDFDGENMVLATITRNDFISNRPNWEVIDWRIAPENESISPWLCSTHDSENFVHEKWLETPELKEITDNLRNVEFDGSFKSSGETLHRIRWNNYRGVVMDDEHYLPDETFGETHVWKFNEARSMIGEIKKFWSEFKGESIMDAKMINAFEPRSSTDTYMEFARLKIQDLIK